MKSASLGFVVASALWLLQPQAAAAQCEGGSTFAGHYLPNGTYWPGGCGNTNPTTPGQLYPSGAQPLQAANPAAGASTVPGQRVATGQSPVTGGDPGLPPGAVGAPLQTLGPGISSGSAWGVYPNVGLPTGGLWNAGNSVGTTGPINRVSATDGLPPTSGTSVLNGVRGTPNVLLPLAGVGVNVDTAGGLYPGLVPGPGALTGGSAYGYSLPAASAVGSEAVSPHAPGSAPAPPPPGRGGPTFIGEEGRDSTTVTLPNP
jgi:hypothetical protein